MRPKWRVTISLDVNGRIPTRFPTKSATRLRLIIEETAWSVTVWKRGACFQWLRDAEKKLDVEFRRDRAGIYSNVPGATAASRKWIASAP